MDRKFIQVVCWIMAAVMIVGLLAMITGCADQTDPIGTDGESTAAESSAASAATDVDDTVAAAYEAMQGKVISILSASTSTFAGYIPVADGFNLEHRTRYPQDNLLTDVNETWWMQLITELDAKLGINDSWAGSQVFNNIDGNSGDVGEDAAMASLTRILNLGSNGTPDIILFYGGGNDMGRSVPLGEFDPNTAPTEVDLTTTKWETFADAYVDAIMRLQYYYPDALIVSISSHYTGRYITKENVIKYAALMTEICNHYGVARLDLRGSKVKVSDLPDGIHPNAAGMDYITDAVLEKLLSICEMETGENVVYTVSHNLTDVQASLGYYKGVSSGKSFAETLTGLNPTVTVTMGGVDITESCYSNGKIFIEEVTGDLVITAADCAYGKYFQQLPEGASASTNLWAVLEHDSVYYTANGWGNYPSGTAYSVTVPIRGGDRIWATSFGAAGENGFTKNGVRLTWFDENGVLQSMTRDEVYAQFCEFGCLIAPEGAVAVNVVMSSESNENEFYILTL